MSSPIYFWRKTIEGIFELIPHNMVAKGRGCVIERGGKWTWRFGELNGEAKTCRRAASKVADAAKAQHPGERCITRGWEIVS